MSSLKKKDLYKDQHGLISILVVTILTIILSLIAIGFSKLADRELRQASDREASAQAYYAAQSGINDAKAYLATSGNGFPGCNPPVGVSSYFKQDLTGGTGVAKYSCISIDKTPQWLPTTVRPNKPQLLKISAPGINHLFIAWENLNYSTQFQPAGSSSLPPEDVVASNMTGVLRVGLYAVPAGSTNNDVLSNLSRVYYLYPNTANGSAWVTDYSQGCYSVSTGLNCGLSPNFNGSLVFGNCQNPGLNPGGSTVAKTHFCNSEITNLPDQTYYLYLTAQYAPLSVSIQATNGSNKNVDFVDSQATVDVTGQSSGIIQRIRATVNLGSQFDLPNYAIQSMESICKNFSIDVTGGAYGPAHPGENNDSACSTPSGNGPIVPGGMGGH